MNLLKIIVKVGCIAIIVIVLLLAYTYGNYYAETKDWPDDEDTPESIMVNEYQASIEINAGGRLYNIFGFNYLTIDYVQMKIDWEKITYWKYLHDQLDSFGNSLAMSESDVRVSVLLNDERIFYEPDSSLWHIHFIEITELSTYPHYNITILAVKADTPYTAESQSFGVHYPNIKINYKSPEYTGIIFGDLFLEDMLD